MNESERVSPLGSTSAAKALAIAIAALYFGFTFVMGSTTRALAPDLVFTARDKLMHAVGFGVMQWTHWFAAIALFPQLSRKARMVGTVVSATLAGGLLELWQAFLPHRTAEFFDFVADGVGATLAALLLSWLLRRRQA